MRLRTLISVALVGLRTNLGRSILTVLGVVIGVMAIVLVVSLGQSARQIILGELEGIGAGTITVRPGSLGVGASSGIGSLVSRVLTAQDVAALRRSTNVPGVAAVLPAVFVPEAVTRADEIFSGTVFGWSAEALGTIYGIYPAEGDFFTDSDIAARRRDAVIGWRAREELFGSGEALGQSVTIKGQAFRVVGVLPASGQVSLFNPDDLVVIPYTVAQEQILGVSHFHEIIVLAADPSLVDQVADDVRQTVRETHGIAQAADDDFAVITQADTLAILGTVTQALTIFLTAIASISLVVGGVGITNIMLVAVTERTGEIGLRKAIGATSRDVGRQFLAEATLLTVSGGVIGTALAAGASAVIALVVRYGFGIAWEVTVPVPAIVLGIGMAALVGLVFGTYPARQAARLSPVEALRHE